jgi:hypothetical protein
VTAEEVFHAELPEQGKVPARRSRGMLKYWSISSAALRNQMMLKHDDVPRAFIPRPFEFLEPALLLSELIGHLLGRVNEARIEHDADSPCWRNA